MLNDYNIQSAVLKCEPSRRERWVKKQVEKGVQVIITHPKRIETGLDLLAIPNHHLDGYRIQRLHCLCKPPDAVGASAKPNLSKSTSMPTKRRCKKTPSLSLPPKSPPPCALMVTPSPTIHWPNSTAWPVHRHRHRPGPHCHRSRPAPRRLLSKMPSAKPMKNSAVATPSLVNMKW